MAQLQEDQVRESIIDAAERLFDRFGYRKTTVEEIAQEAGIGKGSVYLHFDSKEAIGLEWVKRLHTELTNAYCNLLSEPGEPVERLKQALEARVMIRYDLLERHGQSVDDVISQIPDVARQRRDAFHAREAEHLARFIEEAVGPDGMSPLSSNDAAQAMVIATNSLLPYNAKLPFKNDRDTVLRKAQLVIQVLIRALNVPQENRQ